MGRIRTVKPDLFRHEDLYEAEKRTGFPLRLIFIAMFTVADREGRFLWRLRSLKLDVVPYDEFDFPAAMNALVDAGFIRRYMVDGETYGCIPSFPKHQRPNMREPASHIPEPPREDDAHARICKRVHAHEEGEGEGEGNRKGKERSAKPCKTGSAEKSNGLFDLWWRAYPRHAPSRAAAEKAFLGTRPSPQRVEEMVSWIATAKLSAQWQDKSKIPYATTWLHQRYWEGDPPPIAHIAEKGRSPDLYVGLSTPAPPAGPQCEECNDSGRIITATDPSNKTAYRAPWSQDRSEITAVWENYREERCSCAAGAAQGGSLHAR